MQTRSSLISGFTRNGYAKDGKPPSPSDIVMAQIASHRLLVYGIEVRSESIDVDGKKAVAYPFPNWMVILNFERGRMSLNGNGQSGEHRLAVDLGREGHRWVESPEEIGDGFHGYRPVPRRPLNGMSK